MVVSGTIDLEVCAQALQSSDALGFYLRLGRNIVSCYQSVETEHKVLPCPPLKPLGDGINRWRFGGVPFSWRDLTPVSMLALDQFVLWVHADTPYKTTADYVAAIKASPDKTFK
ncbi:hypothetical protein EBZ39_06075, partial [bacterium]|nr:hypothetical protein [bacterium]